LCDESPRSGGSKDPLAFDAIADALVADNGGYWLACAGSQRNGFTQLRVRGKIPMIIRRKLAKRR
jgi:hypothetical protein